MRIALLGTVDSSVVALRELVNSGCAPTQVLTLESARRSRHSDYADLALEGRKLGVPVTSVSTARSPDVVARLRELDLDLLLVIGWSEILPNDILAAARHGAIGYHPSHLPALRGRAVIPWTVLLGCSHTGSTLFWLTAGLDDGDIAYQRTFAVDPRETSTSLYAKHMEALAAMVRELAGSGSVDRIPRRPQLGEPSYCAQRRPVDGLLDLAADVAAVDRLVRASTRPYPGARAFLARNGTEIVVWAGTPMASSYHGLPGQVVACPDGRPLVTCGEGILRIDDATAADGAPITLRVQDRLLPHSLALHRWSADRPL
jgi:methionyl-tRNA formyltransferase